MVVVAEQNTEPDPESPTPAADPAASAPVAAPAGPAPTASPAPTAAPDRRAQRLGWGVKEMAVAVGVLVVAVLVLGVFTHDFTFNPGGPSTNVATGGPSIDESQQYQVAAGQLHFPLRQPKLPADWHANSASLDQVGPTALNSRPNDLRIGFITPAGRYVAIAESTAAATDLARQTAGLPDATPIGEQGTVDVDGKAWTVYQGARNEVSWGLDLGAVRLMVSGNGNQAEFTTMAKAVQSAPVLPTRGA
jgi:hypothetical protein